MTRKKVFVLVCLGSSFLQALFAQTQEPHFVNIGEGYTSAQAGDEMQVEGRMFSAPDPICADLHGANRLEGPSRVLELSVGKGFGLGELRVIAVDSRGDPVRPIPVAVEVEEKSFERLNMDEYRAGGREIVPLQSGDLLFRVRSICSDTVKSAVVRATVR